MRKLATDLFGIGVRWVIGGSCCGLLGLIACACTFDPDHRCGPYEVVWGDNVKCVCVAGAVLTDKGCVPCGPNEVVEGTRCACAPGYSRTSDIGACELASDAATADQAASTGRGTSCNVQTASCLDPVYKHCEPTSTGGYCTTAGCATSADCGGGYACDTAVSPTVCRRPPLGQGNPCTKTEDCTGGEATYCDTFVSHNCLVQGCTLTPNNCFEGWECCDLSAVGIAQPLCLPKGQCTK